MVYRIAICIYDIFCLLLYKGFQINDDTGEIMKVVINKAGYMTPDYKPKKIEIKTYYNKHGYFVVRIYHWNDKWVRPTVMGSNLTELEKDIDLGSEDFNIWIDEFKEFHVGVIPENKDEEKMLRDTIPLFWIEKYETTIIFVKPSMMLCKQRKGD